MNQETNRGPRGPRAIYLPYVSEVYGPRAGPPISEIIRDPDYGCYDESYYDNDEPDACGPEQELFDNIYDDVKERKRKNLLTNDAVINPTLNVNNNRRFNTDIIQADPFIFHRGIGGRAAGPHTFISNGIHPYGPGAYDGRPEAYEQRQQSSSVRRDVALMEEDSGMYGPARGPVMRR